MLSHAQHSLGFGAGQAGSGLLSPADRQHVADRDAMRTWLRYRVGWERLRSLVNPDDVRQVAQLYLAAADVMRDVDLADAASIDAALGAFQLARAVTWVWGTTCSPN